MLALHVPRDWANIALKVRPDYAHNYSQAAIQASILKGQRPPSHRMFCDGHFHRMIRNRWAFCTWKMLRSMKAHLDIEQPARMVQVIHVPTLRVGLDYLILSDRGIDACLIELLILELCRVPFPLLSNY